MLTEWEANLLESVKGQLNEGADDLIRDVLNELIRGRRVPKDVFEEFEEEFLRKVDRALEGPNITYNYNITFPPQSKGQSAA